MKETDFITLVTGVLGGLLFSLGLCMCLLPQWDMFREGVIATAAGAGVLIALAVTLRLRSGKKAKPVNWKLVGKITYAVFAALVLGVGMCLIMVFDQMLLGIIIGMAGILLLLFLIPMFMGFK